MEEEQEAIRPKKRRSPEAPLTATPAPKASKPEYPWNTTQSAIKLQQKTLREANKKAVAAKAAIKRKKKNTLHRIFLSEEQQHVLNMVVENKNSVFFTGSAGKYSLPLALAVANDDQVPVNPSCCGKSSRACDGSTSVSLIE